MTAPFRALAGGLGAILVASPGAAQISPRAWVDVTRVEHRVRYAGVLAPTAGTLFGAGLGLVVGSRYEVWGEARGGRLAGDSGDADATEVAEVQLAGAAHLNPWLLVQGIVNVRNYSTSLAKQRWTSLRLGSEARLPLSFPGLQGVLRAQWMPVVSVTGQTQPDVALAAEAGVAWSGARFGVAMLYALERYDFPQSVSAQRLEEVSGLQVQGSVRLRRP